MVTKYQISKDTKSKTLEDPRYGDRVYMSHQSTGIFVIEAVLRSDVIMVFERRPAKLFMLMRTTPELWTLVGDWELKKGTRRSIIIRDITKKYAKKVPDIGDECLVVLEGEIHKAQTILVDNRMAQFDVVGEFGSMVNIPFSKFRPV